MRNTNIIYQQVYSDVGIEYGNMVKEPVTPNDNDVIDKFWNLYNSQKVPDEKLN